MNDEDYVPLLTTLSERGCSWSGVGTRFLGRCKWCGKVAEVEEIV